MYYDAFPNDKMILKGAVMLLFLIGLMQMIFVLHDGYYMVYIFCSSIELEFAGVTLFLAPALGKPCLHSLNIVLSLHFTVAAIVQFS
jgi:hypothetical protein